MLYILTTNAQVAISEYLYLRQHEQIIIILRFLAFVYFFIRTIVSKLKQCLWRQILQLVLLAKVIPNRNDEFLNVDL